MLERLQDLAQRLQGAQWELQHRRQPQWHGNSKDVHHDQCHQPGQGRRRGKRAEGLELEHLLVHEASLEKLSYIVSFPTTDILPAGPSDWQQPTVVHSPLKESMANCPSRIYFLQQSRRLQGEGISIHSGLVYSTFHRMSILQIIREAFVSVRRRHP